VLDLDTIATRLAATEPRVVLSGDDWRRAAVAELFREGPDGPELLFIRRARHEADPWSGHVGFPGGQSEEGDASLEHTAARETLEELGIDLLGDPACRRLGPLDELRAMARGRALSMVIRPYAFGWRGPAPPELAPNDEVAEAFWAPLSWLTDPARRITYRISRHDNLLELPAVDLGPDNVLWGLTHRMTLDLLERLGLAN